EGLFYDCPLESLYLGRDLSYDISSEYGYSPFYNKESLSSLIVGSSVTAIGCGLFEECSGLTEIYSLSSIPAVCDVLPFWGVDKTIPVYIPFGAKNAYKSASEWKDFTNFIESEFTGVDEEVISTSDIKVISGNGIEINDYYGRIRIVNLAGQVIKETYVNGSAQISLPKGIYIIVTENNSQKVVL
ncbi:MAG: T9SS type A sorting domain-containing protein, partial [Bacteroidaceae bacterium]|nr:T9SS type A sorting domain-containing protein [Bacteroidaceae bacterium]